MCVSMVKNEMLGLAAKYGLSDVREDLSVVGILCGHILCRKCSCSLSFSLCFRLVILLFYVFIVVPSVL